MHEAQNIGLRASNFESRRSTVPDGYGHRIFSSIKKSDKHFEMGSDQRPATSSQINFEIALHEIKDETMLSKVPYGGSTIQEEGEIENARTPQNSLPPQTFQTQITIENNDEDQLTAREKLETQGRDLLKTDHKYSNKLLLDDKLLLEEKIDFAHEEYPDLEEPKMSDNVAF